MAVVLGVNSGFVTQAPVADPASTATTTVDGFSNVTKDISPANAVKITEVGWWCDNATEATNFEMGLYAADGVVVPGEAGTLIHVERINAKGTTAGWKRVTVDWEISGNTPYWIAIQADQTITATITDWRFTEGLGRDSINGTQTTLPSPFGGGAYNAAWMGAFYAVVEEAVGTNMKINISDVFKDIESLKINIGNVWKDVVQVLQNIGGVWKNVFG